jgi:hypothetical protein
MRVTVGLVLVSLTAGMAMGQSTVRGSRSAQRPTIDPRTGSYIIHGFSKDQIWAAAMKVLKADKIEVAQTSKSYIIARQTTGDRMEVDVAVVDHPTVDPIRPWAPAVVLNIDVPALGELGDFPGWLKDQRMAFSRALSEKIIDVLYAPGKLPLTS